MLDLLILLVGLGGFAMAGYYDLKTSEFPDLIPYGMLASIIIIRASYSIYSNSYAGLAESVFTGILFFSIGFLLYFAKQWGNGDAWLLGILGFIHPNSFLDVKNKLAFSLPVQANIIINFLVISFFYMLAYYIAIGLRNREIIRIFSSKLKSRIGKKTIRNGAFLFGAYYFFVLYISSISQIVQRNILLYINLPSLIVFYFLISEYSKIVEFKFFRKKISVRNLKEGDVLASSRYRGLTGKEIKIIRNEKNYVWIKNGVRFVPSFFISVLFLVFFGSLI